MKGRNILFIVLGFALAYSAFLIAIDNGAFNGGEPEIFQDHHDFTAAAQEAKIQNRIVVIDMMASWCPPCREMDRRVWVDDSLTTWLRDNTIPVQIDVDENEDTARKFNIEALPTIIVYDANRDIEIGRQVGYMEAPDLLDWLTLMQQQKTFTPEQSDTNTQPPSDANNQTPSDENTQNDH